MSTEINITEQSVAVEVTEEQININVTTNEIDIESTEQVITISASSGIVYNANTLSGLEDVDATSPSDGDVLQYVASTNKWTKTNSINFGTW
jgi:frataxin-like iron-binding protein CyaY